MAPHPRRLLGAALVALALGGPAQACCRLLGDAPGAGRLDVAVVIAQSGRHVTLRILPTLAVAPLLPRPMAVLMVLPGEAAGAVPQTVAAAPLVALLDVTAPVLLRSADPDPCFQRGAPAPLTPVRLAPTPTTGAAGAAAVFGIGDTARLRTWLAARDVPDAGALPSGPLLAMTATIGPGGRAMAAVQLSYDSDSLGLPMDDAQPAVSLTVLAMDAAGRMLPQGGAARLLPVGGDLPEFVAGQFDHVIDAALMHLAAPVTEIYAGPVPGGFVTRWHVEGVSPLLLRPAGDRAAFAPAFGTHVAWKGRYTLACSAGFDYRHRVTARWQQESATLGGLTGWSAADIRRAMVDHWQATREPD